VVGDDDHGIRLLNLTQQVRDRVLALAAMAQAPDTMIVIALLDLIFFGQVDQFPHLVRHQLQPSDG